MRTIKVPYGAGWIVALSDRFVTFHCKHQDRLRPRWFWNILYRLHKIAQDRFIESQFRGWTEWRNSHPNTALSHFFEKFD